MVKSSRRGVRAAHWLCAVALCLPTVSFAADVVSSVRPIQTELVAPFDLTRVQVGSSVLVRLIEEWSTPGCKLRAGSIVQGHVVNFSRHSKTLKDSRADLAFDAADCDGHPQVPHRFSLVALIGGPPDSYYEKQQGLAESPPLADAVGLSTSGGIRSVSSASSINENIPLPQRENPSRVKQGDVIGLQKIYLKMGNGPDGVTVVGAQGRDLRLERGTRLVLIQTAEQAGLKAALTKTVVYGQGDIPSKPIVTTKTEVLSNAKPEPVDETEICSGTCNTVTGAPVETGAAGTLAGRLNISEQGYAPRGKREAASFHNDTTLTYLSNGNLLVTFDPHQLRQRLGTAEEPLHDIRALVIDPATRSVRRVVEWRVESDSQYLWHLSHGRVLVHLRHALLLYDADLKPLRSIPVEGRVAWVVTSPSSDHIVIGTIKERHSEQVHRELEDAMAESPEEDVQVKILDANFKVLVTAVRSSKMSAPVLTDAGELRLQAAGHNVWKITEFLWDRTERKVATTKSTCRPALSTPQHGLIFEVGCTTSGGKWYRALREDGHPLLKGESPSDEIEQSAEGSVDGAFAVRVVKTAKPWGYAQPFTRADLTRENIAIYRGSDGKSLGSISSDDFTLSQLSFAVSPSGTQLALIGGDSILFYSVTTSAR